MKELFESVSIWQIAAWAVVVLLAVWILVGRGAQIARFVGETKAELKKCSWPWNPELTGAKKYKELLDSTLVVAVSALFLSAFVTVADFVFAHAIGAFTHLH
jgi:preprotein translocase subunit SecE